MKNFAKDICDHKIVNGRVQYLSFTGYVLLEVEESTHRALSEYINFISRVRMDSCADQLESIVELLRKHNELR